MPVAAADEVFSVNSIINLPPTSPGPNNPGLANKPLASFDIEFVDPAAGVLLLADRSNKSIVVASTSSNLVISQLQPGFVGPVTAGTVMTPNPACPFHPFPAPGANCSGPNGVLTVVHKQGNGRGSGPRATTEVWATDGNSRVWVLDLKTGTPIGPSPISTAITSGDPNRADELCYDPDDGIVLVANPNSSPHGFVTFISTDTYKVLGHIVMDGTNGTGLNMHGGETPPNAVGGIEQCQYSPRTGKFYINVPKASLLKNPVASDPVYDLVLQIDPVSEAIDNTVNLTKQSPSTACVTTTGAAGITGMALGPSPQIAIACGALGSVVISEKFSGDTTPQVYPIAGATGADEIWYNPGDNQYFFATVFNPTTKQIILNVVDAIGDNPPSSVPQEDRVATLAPATMPICQAPCAIGNKAAADPVANQVYVPVNPANAAASNICAANIDANGKSGDNTQGCIAIFTTVHDDPPSSNKGKGNGNGNGNGNGD